ncbi:MAG TPA: hypothetical protein EYF95_05315 [Flavobacteriales bacterium]|nr:hypothetical protein [Flavobacteriales bacterium]
MLVGDLVQIKMAKGAEDWPGRESIFAGLHGMILQDHSPMRPPNVGRVFDVLWSNGAIEDMYSDDLEVADGNR